MYTEYVFDNKKYDVVLREIKASLFDVISSEQSKIASIREKANNTQDGDLRELLSRMCDEQDACVAKLVSLSEDFGKILKKIDSYSREIKRVEDKNNAILVDDLSRKVEIAEQLLGTQPQIQELVEAVNNGGNVEELIAAMNQGKSISATNAEVESKKPVPPKEEKQEISTSEPVIKSYQMDFPTSVVTGAPENEKTTMVEEPTNPEPVVSDVKPVDEVVPSTEPTSAVEDEAVDPAMSVAIPYDDSISVDDAAPSTEPTDAIEDGAIDPAMSVAIPYDDSISADDAAPSTEPTAAVEDETVDPAMSVAIPYDDSISVDDAPSIEPTAAIEDGAIDPAMSVAIPYDDSISADDAMTSTGESSVSEVETPEVASETPTDAPTIDTNEVTTDGGEILLPIPEETATEIAVEVAPTSVEQANTLVLKKRNSDVAKVILTSALQVDKLRKSLPTQEALLSAQGLFQTTSGDVMSDKETQVQQMMDQANQLYSDGKVDEAQKIFDDISEMSKELNTDKGVGLVA